MKNDVVNIKGTRQGLVIILDTSKNFTDVKQSLIAKITEKKGFFQGGKFTFDMATGSLDDSQRLELEEVCRQFGLEYSPDIQPLDFHKNRFPASDANTANKPEAQLKDFSNKTPHRETKARNQVPAKKHKPITTGEVIPLQGVLDTELQQSGLMINSSLRSGQKINYDGNVVVLGDVNPGAEIVTTGSIVVMGVLRGIAHAGASGDSSATITAYAIRPTQLRIADLIGIAPADDARKPTTIWPEVARISDGHIVIDHCFTNRMKKTV